MTGRIGTAHDGYVLSLAAIPDGGVKVPVSTSSATNNDGNGNGSGNGNRSIILDSDGGGGRGFVSSGADGKVRIWDLRHINSGPVHTFDEEAASAASKIDDKDVDGTTDRDGGDVNVNGDDGVGVMMWSVACRRTDVSPLGTTQVPGGQATTRRKIRCASVGDDGIVRIHSCDG